MATSAPWQPDRAALEKILKLLRDTQGATNEQHRHIQQELQRFNSPEFNMYLCFILVHLKTEQEVVRQLAGLLLKKHVKDYYEQMGPDVQGYIKNELLQAIGDPSHFIRAAVGTVATAIVTQGSLEAWPTLLRTLAHCLDSQDPYLVDGAFDALYKICEDSADKMDSEALGRPLNVLIPKFLSFFRSPQETFRKNSVGCINQFVLLMPNALLVNMDGYLQGLFSLASDPSSEVRKRVCQALVMLLEVRMDFLLPHIKNVIEYMLIATQDLDELVALEACEFWSAFCETKVSKDILREYIPRLVPVLLKGMVYSEMDLTLLDGEEEDEMVPDRPEDVRPRFYHPKSAAAQHGNASSGGDQGDAANGDESGQVGDDDDDDGDYDDDDDEDVSEWNLRKCSAAGLDITSGVFGDEILPVLLPLVQERLASDRWEVRESVILALGAIAEGCIGGMKPHLGQLIPYLVTVLADPKPLVRSITCWTLSRYSKWIVEQGEHERYLQPLMQKLLERVLDHNKKVQEAACSAFATLEEEAQALLVPYLGPILQSLMFAFQKYQAKNLLILYDAIGTLADSVGHELNRPEYVAILMPPLILKWNQLADNDKNLFPLLECLTSVAQALGPGFQEFSEPVFQRCLKLIDNTLRAHPETDEPDREFIVCALDLLSGLAEGLRSGIEPLIAKGTLLPLLVECAKDTAPDVRQSAFALIGDLAKTCIGHLTQYLGAIIPLLTTNLNPEYISVCNNASWALGEIAVKVGDDLKLFVPTVLAYLIPLMNKHNINKSLLENTAITIGRLGMVCPDVVAPHLPEFIQAWCVSLRNIREDIEKEHAFRGLCAIVTLNPYGVGNALVYMCDAIASWYDPRPDLRDQFYQILHAFKNSVGGPDIWKQYLESFPPNLRQVLIDRYQLGPGP